MKTKSLSGGVTSWGVFRIALLISTLTLIGSLVVPALAAPALDGEGTMSVEPANITYGSAGNTFTFTFTANIGDFGNGSQVALLIPAGWTAPTTAAGPGHVTVQTGTCTLKADPLAVTGTTIFVDLVSCTAGQSFTIIYSGITSPSPTGSPYMFQVQTDIGPGGAGLVNITAGSPAVTVNPATLTVSATGLTPQNKVYDGTPDAALVIGNPTLLGILGTDSVALDTSTAFGLFDNKNIGTAKTVTVNGLTLTGPDAPNYILNIPTRTANISKKPVSVTAITDNKVYDGTSISTGIPILNVPLGSGDSANFVQTFNNRNVGSSKTITPSGTVNDGNNGLNYSYSFTPVTTGIITARGVTITAVTDTKAYDGTTNSTGVPTVSVATPLGSGDTGAWTQTFDSKNVGTGKTLSPIGKVLDGNNGLNYSYTFESILTGEITAKPITVTANARSKSYGAVDPVLTFTVTPALITGDNLSGGLVRSLGNDVGAYAIIRGTLDNSNYAITYIGADLTITKAALTVSADNQTVNVGEPDPFFSLGYSGFMYGETSSVIDNVPTCGVSGDHVLPGKYTIACTGGLDNNYNFVFKNGTLTITAIPTLLSPGTDEHLFTNSFVTFDWADIPSAINYTVQIASNNSFTTLLVNKIVATSTFTDQVTLPANKTLFWRVRSFGPYGTSAWATYRSFVTANPPSIPALLTPALNALATIYNPTLDWNNSVLPVTTTFGRYRIQVATNVTFTTDLREYTTNETFVTDSLIIPAPDLDTNTKYFWRVRSENSLNQYSAWSTIRYFRTALVPVILNALPNSDHPSVLRPTFSWSDPNLTAPLATGYSIQISSVSNFSTLVTSGITSTPSYTPSLNLPAGKLLYWRVRANGVNGPSLWTTGFFTTPTPPSSAGLLLPANNSLNTNYTPLFKWSVVTLPLGTTFQNYKLQVDDNQDFSSPEIDDTSITNRLTPQFQVVTPLAHNTKFYWRVLAFNTLGQYSPSVVWSFRTALTPPTLLSPNTGSNELALRPTFEWDDVVETGLTGYTIQISTVNTFATLTNTGSPVTSSYTPAVDLPKNKLLYWRVQTRGTNGPSAWSEVRSFTSANAPTTPVLTTPALNALLTDDTPLLKWNPATIPLGTTFHHYWLQVDDNSDFSSPVIDDTSITNRLTPQFQVVTPLAHNTKFYWRLCAVNTDNEVSNWSTVGFFRVAADAPTLLTPANGTPAGTLKPTFDWDPPTGLVTSYTLQVATTPTFTTLLVNSTTVDSSYTRLTNLPAAKTLYWRVKVNGPNGPSAWSTTFSFTTP